MKLKRCFLTTVIVLLISVSAFARSPVMDIALRSDYKLMSEPLTTEKVGFLDPTQLNPHLQRWVVSRRVEMLQLKPRLLSSRPFAEKPSPSPSPDRHPRSKPQARPQLYGVQFKGLLSETEGYIRAKGPWYRPFSEFRCEKQPNSWFGTEDGAKVAAASAAESWADLLKVEKVRLSLLLDRVAGESETSAMGEAELIFQSWLESVESLWRAQAFKKARSDEWSSYLGAASTDPTCGQNNQEPVVPPSWRSMMESMTENQVGSPPPVSKLLARAPARLWNGLFSVRVSITLGGKTLRNGRFLIRFRSETERNVADLGLKVREFFLPGLLFPHLLSRKSVEEHSRSRVEGWPGGQRWRK